MQTEAKRKRGGRMKKDFMKIDPGGRAATAPPPGTRSPGFLMRWALFAPPLKVTVIGSEEPPSPVTNDPTVPPRLCLSSCVPHPSLSTLPSLPGGDHKTLQRRAA